MAALREDAEDRSEILGRTGAHPAVESRVPAMRPRPTRLSLPPATAELAPLGLAAPDLRGGVTGRMSGRPSDDWRPDHSGASIALLARHDWRTTRTGLTNDMRPPVARDTARDDGGVTGRTCPVSRSHGCADERRWERPLASLHGLSNESSPKNFFASGMSPVDMDALRQPPPRPNMAGLEVSWAEDSASSSCSRRNGGSVVAALFETIGVVESRLLRRRPGTNGSAAGIASADMAPRGVSGDDNEARCIGAAFGGGDGEGTRRVGAALGDIDGDGVRREGEGAAGEGDRRFGDSDGEGVRRAAAAARGVPSPIAPSCSMPTCSTRSNSTPVVTAPVYCLCKCRSISAWGDDP